MIRWQAMRDLRALDIATFSEWAGEMPPPKAKTAEDRQRIRAHEEGSAARREFRAGLSRLARGEWNQPLVEGQRLNEFGEVVDAKGRIVATSAAHIKQILKRVARMRV